MGALRRDVVAVAAELCGPQCAGDFEPDDSGRSAYERDAVWICGFGVQFLLYGGEPRVGVLHRSQGRVGDDPGGGDGVVAGFRGACVDGGAGGDVCGAGCAGVWGRCYVSCGVGHGSGDAAGGASIVWVGAGL